MIVVAALYKFANLPDRETIAHSLKKLCAAKNILGTLIIAQEGINGTVAGNREAIDSLIAFFNSNTRFLGMEYKESFAETNPFLRLKIKLKSEIVTLGQPSANPAEIAGTYVDPKDWNKLLSDPEIVLIDVRNNYEVELGTFKKAINPQTESFRDFPQFVKTTLDPQKHKKIAMHCTGGIRCEKASSLMKKMGFSEVYHLKGGILQYLADVDPEESLWQGECFVFDNRVAVDHNLEPGSYELCHGCRYPISQADKESREYKPGVSCSRCVNTRSEAQRQSGLARQKQIDLAKARGQKHLGTRPQS